MLKERKELLCERDELVNSQTEQENKTDSPGDRQKEGNNSPESKKSSLLDDYADVSTEQPGHMDPDD